MKPDTPPVPSEPARRPWFRRSAAWLALAAFVILAELVALPLVLDARAPSASPSCPSREKLTVAVSPGVKDFAASVPAPDCVTVEFRDAEGFTGAQLLASGKADVWLADSTYTVAVADPALVERSTVVARRGVGLAASAQLRSALTAAPSWALALHADPAVPVPREGEGGDSSAAVMGAAGPILAAAQAATGDSYLGLALAASSINDFAKAKPGRGPVADGALRIGMLDRLPADDVLPTAEGIPTVDVPAVLPTGSTSRTAVATRFVEALGEATKARKKHHFLSPTATSVTIDGVELPMIGADEGPALNLRHALADPSVFTGNILTLTDISGSMGQLSPGQTMTGIDGVRAAAGLFAGSMPGHITIGGWAFAYQLDPPRDYVVSTPRGPLSEVRDSLLLGAKHLAAVPVGTALYSSFDAAYRDVQSTYQEGTINAIAVFTDGRDEDDPGALDLPGVLADIQSIQDPARPIVPLFFAFGDADIEALHRLADPLGGQVLNLASPAQIGGAMIAAIASTARMDPSAG
ncbi:hypothetical protein [Microbacterium sp. p3-SID336]|uniref:hypothetical protein n=1 Tax=Microbacterium sp. p3-SID336 TaxID=2916212 RepID=UPI0021A71412|nr:hypothetical protein [Microbacterium sp. p3-SID336]MCT1478591.1 hypothetical protein [Microbacterium sp. p3-SID336]